MQESDSARAASGTVPPRVSQRSSGAMRRLLNEPRSTATQSPTRNPAVSVTMRIVEVPSTSTVYSNAVLRDIAPAARLPTAAPPRPRSARLLLDWPEPEATPSAPPTSVPAAREP